MINRRELLGAAAFSPLLLGALPDAGVSSAPAAHVVKPLPFEPSKLKGLSEKLLTSHHEHAYAIDFGAAAAKYVDAFFQNLKWEEVERRYEAGRAAQKAWTALAR